MYECLNLRSQYIYAVDVDLCGSTIHIKKNYYTFMSIYKFYLLETKIVLMGIALAVIFCFSKIVNFFILENFT